MNLDEEFEKMYGGAGAVSTTSDLEDEFTKLYGGETKPKFDLDAQSNVNELPDWQRKRISDDKDAERGYNYVMENRRKRQSEPENPEAQTRLDQAIRSDGREYGRKDGENFMTWAKRNKIHVNKKNHDGWMDYYRFEAPDMLEFTEVSPGIVDYKKMGDSVVEAAQEKQRVEMAAKNASAKRRREFIDELEQKGIKEGSFVQFVGKDGETENRFYNGLNEEGRPVFSVAHGKLSKMTSKHKLDLDKFRDLMDEGNAKREDNPLESVRRGVAQETGEDVSVGKAVAERAVPFVGRAMRDTAVEQMKNLSKLHEGDLSYDEIVPSTVPSIAGGGALPQTQTRRLGGVEAVERMAKSIWNDSEALRAEGEDENAYIARVRERATGELKNRVAIQQKAGREEAQVEQGAVDKIVKGGVDSAGYALEFTIAGLPFAPLGPVGAMVGSAAIETAASAPSRQLDLTTPSWALDEKGNLVKISRAMDEDQAKWQAIVGAAAENATEVALEAATLGTLRFAGGWLRKGAKAVAPKGVGAAEAKVAEFMQSDTGLKLMSIGKHYRQFSDRTQINAPWSELAEEHVQRYFDDVMGLGKKPDDYKGFDKESVAFWNDMKSLSYHADTLYGLLGQLAVGGAHAGLAASRDAIDREKVDDEVVKALKRAGISDEAINSLDLEQRVTLCDLWARSKGKPETIKKEIDALDFAVRNVARRALADEAEAARKTVAERGETPATFNIPVAVGKNGKQTVQFEQIGIRDTWTGQEASVRAVLDRQNGVGIVDRGDGLYEAVDTMGGSQVCDNLDDAINAAKDLAVMAQQRKSDREVKKAVIENERANNYGKKNVVYFNTIGDAATQIGEEIAQNGKAYGMSDISQLRDPKNVSRAGFHTADGTTVVILDNVRSPNDIPRLLGHEIIGHGGANGEFGNSQGADEFAGKIRSDDFDSFKEASAQKHQSVTAGETIEQAREAVNANLHEVFAHYAADAERGKPRAFDRLAYAVNIAARKIGLKKTYSDADVRVLLNKWRESAKGTGGETTGSKAERFAFFDVEQSTAPAETHENATVSAPSEKGTTSRPNETAQPTVKEEAKSAPSKPVNERNIVEKLTDKAEAQEIPLSEVEVSDSRIPQFKEGADPETGEVEPLTGEPYDLVSNPIVVMEFKDGKKVVVTGRHRYGLYKRSGRKTIAARVIREADGWTVKDAMAIDAIGNIIDEKGTEKDYVKYFDEAKPTRDEAKSAGFLDRPKGQRAFSIYEGATADTKQLIDWEGAGGDGKISVDQAGIISAAAPKGANPRFGAVQRILTQKALGGLRGKKLGILSRSLAEEAKNRKETPKVGGEMQLDLFTSEEDQALLAFEDKRADYRVKKSGEYNRIAEVLRTAVSKGGKLDLNGEYAKELGITDPKDKKQLIAARDKAIELANYWENAVVLDEADKTSMDEAINAKSGAEAAKREEIQKKAAEKLAAVKEKRTGKKPKDAVSKTETTTQATAEKKSAVEMPKSVSENQKSVPEKPKSVIKKPESVIKNGENVHAEPKTKMKNAAEEAKAQKLEDDLAALFMSEEYNPSVPKKEVSKWRKFDVKKPDGEKGSVHAYTMRQAQGAAKQKYGLGSVVYEQGGLENAIIRERERRAGERNQQIHERYPVGAGVLGSDFSGAVKAALDGGTAQQVASLLVQANQGRVQRSVVFAIGRREKLTDSDGATYYTDGTVVVQLHDGKSSDPLKFNRELLRVLANADAFGNLKDIEFLRGTEDRIYGMMKGVPVVQRAYPSSAEVEKFLDGAGFSKVGVHPRVPGMIWKKGLITLNQNNLRFGLSADGKLVPLFSEKIGTHQNVGIDFASDEFDPAVFQKRVGVLAELAKTYVDNGVGKFDTLAERLYARFGEKFDSMKPYLRGIWNAVAEQLDLPEVSREQANDVFARIEKSSESKPTVEKQTEKALTKGERISNAANELVALIEKGEKFDRRTLEETVARHLGGSVAEGTFTPKDASDILELAVNRIVLKRKGELSASANESVDEAVGAIGEIRKILGVLPTQTVRSDEQIKMQQFSTPPHEAFAVNWVANIRPNDVALEPSAGIGGIAVFAKASGARKIVANELSDRRREILNELSIADNLYGVDAAKIWQHLFWEVNKGNAERPTVVVMNPPFSSSVVSGRHSTIGVGGAHIEAALDSLAQGGRLVAVVGNGMSYDSPSKSSAAWWKKIGSKYRIMANVRVNGNEYAKYGTNFDNNIIVIDKVEPDPTVKPVFGKIESLDEFPALMEGVRNARPGSNQQTESASDKQTGRGGNETPRTGLVSVGKPEQPDGRTGDSLFDAGAVGGRRGKSKPSGVAGNVVDTGSPSGNVRGGNKGSSGQGGRKGNTAGRDRINNVSPGGDELGEAGGRTDNNSGLLAVSDLKSENPQGGNEEVRTVGDGTFAVYKPSKLNISGMKPHPGEIVESAAMASVKTPDITYSPRIPKELVEKGQPSDAQLEVITLAGQAGEQKLPNGQRRGFFTQDGTGMGKGTEIGGVICDNWNHGRKKAIWISKNKKLFPDAQRDLSTYGLEKEVFWFSKDKSKKGNIAFLSYDTLQDNASVTDKGNVVPGKGDSCNFTKLVEWFGKDYDGVIVFDESHMMANVEGKKTKRGTSAGAKLAKIAVKLQELLPNARVLYASATGATEVSHLACLPRLGLWGEGTSFKTKGEFIDKISNGGLSMMEMVARDMKAAGLTLSRSLTMEGIVNRPLVHKLSPDQTRMYDTCAGAWQEVYDNIFDTIASTGEIHNGTDVGKIVGQMKGAQQRFFNSLLTSMMMPSVISDIKRNLADGKSIVIQLTQTNEAAMNRAIAKGRGDDNFNVEEIDTSPRDIIRGYVEHSFPTFVYTEVEDENGKKSWRVVEDSEGKRLQDPAALERKQALLDKIDMMNLDKSPLDRILEEFGYDKVAEVTGRTKRIETREENGEIKTVIASRSSDKNGEAETAEFNAGKRRILIFSEAGGTGKSYHASRTFENQQQRIHYLLQAGWSAPPAIQGLGRTNRTNQASKPEYVLCTTDVKGHLRFISSVARRLQQMGSLTSGDRSTAGNGVFNEDQNIEDVYSKRALVKIFTELFHDDPAEFTRVSRMMGFVRPKVDTETGERSEYNKLIDPETGGLDNEKIPDVTDFLNIMLHLRIADMNRFFDQFMQTRNDLIESAKLNGKYDPGLEKLIAEKIEEKSRTQIYEDPATGSKTEVVELGVSQKSKKRSLASVTTMMEDARKRGGQAFFAVNKQSNILYAFAEARYTETDSSGIVHKRFYRLSPDGTTSSLLDKEVRTDENGNYEIVSDGDMRWDAEYAKVPDLIEGNNYYVTGAILPVFGRLGIEDPRVKRIEPTGKKTSFLGLEIPNSMVDQVMANFGQGDASSANSPGAVYRRIVNDGKGVDLQRDGWKLRRARVNYDTAIELVGLEGPEEARRLEQLGYGRFDRSSGKPRFFIPRTEAGVAKFLADYPVKVDEAPQVFFDSPEFDPEAEEKTFGITNEDEKFMLEAASMPIPKHVTKADDVLMVQAEHLLSNRDFMRKLAHAVVQKARPTSDAQNVALGIYSEQCADALNTAKRAYDDMVAELELLPPDADQETVDVTKKSIAALRKELAGARRDFREAAMAKRAGASEHGRALRTNRFIFSTADYSYAGLRGIVQSEIGKAEIPEEMDAEIGKLAGNFKDLDERSRKMAVERLKLFAQKVVNDLKAGGRKASSSGPKAAGNELKRVMRNYEDALNQVQVHAEEAGGTLIGMSDQLYPSWGKWLKAIGEYHCFMNPDITEQEVIDAIRADLGRYLTDGIDEETVRDVLTGFGHNYRQSRYDSQRKMNDLKAQALSKRQRDYMIENGKLPPQTGMVRDEPSDETRALRKEVQQIKKDIDEQEGGPRALKGALASAKTRVRNTIADLENAIARGERIERSHRTLMEDAELQQLKKRRDELREEYEAMFGEKSALTDEQRLQRAEKMLRKTLERALERLGRAYGGDFSTAPRVRLDNATTAQLREEIANTNRIIRDLKDAAYPMGTPEEIAKRNANRIKRREEAIQRLQARIISGDIRPQAKPVPPMPPDMQKQYDALGDQMKAAHRRLQQLREEARHATWFAVPRAALDGFNYMVGSIMTNAASYDRSAVLRQALRLTAAKPVDAAKAYAKAEKAAWNENYFNEVNDKLLADPIIDEGMKKYGLRLHSTDIAHIHTIELFKTPNSVEPRFITRIGQMIGGIPVIGKIGKGLHGAHTYIKAGSERHYVTYLNLMAGQTYKLLVDAVTGGASDFQKRKFAGLVNILTGAASIPENLRHGINMVNTIGGNVAPVIWSPSLWVSQIEQVVPIDVFGAYFGKKDDVKRGANAYAEATYVAKEAMKLRIRAGLAIAALGALLSYAFGDDDWWNELVADVRRGNLRRVWNKIHHPVVGKTHLDLEMGERAFSRTLGALVTGKTETSTGRTKELGSYGAGDWYNMFGRYVGGKFSPAYGGIVSLLQKRDYIGNPYGFKEFASSWIPLSVGDVFQSAMEDSWLDGTAPVAVAMTMLGAGGSVYDEKYYERTVNPFLESVKDIEKTVSDPLLDREEKDLIVKNIKDAAGGIFSNDSKWREAYGLAKQISVADGKIKKAIKQFETAQASGRKFDETSAVKNIEKATGALDAQKRRLMEMIQQGKDNYLRPWRR